MDEKLIIPYVTEKEKIDFNLFGVSTPMLHLLQKAIQAEYHLRSIKISFKADRAQARDNVGKQYSLKLHGSHVEFDQ